MAEVLLKDAPPKARDLFNKGFGAFERGNIDYALDLLSSALEICPGLLQARKFLRAAELRRFKNKKGGAVTHALSSVSGLPTYVKTSMLVKSGRGLEALSGAERLLRIDPLNKPFITLFAAASKTAEMPEAGIQTLELAKDHYPDDVAVLKELGLLYQAEGRTKDARACYERLCELKPNDPDLVKLLKDAMALDSMRTDGWSAASETGGTYRQMIRDQKEAQLLEQDSKAVKTEEDADALIANTKEKIEAEPDNVNHHRSLARLYAERKRFDEAIASLEKALEVSGADPEVSAMISRVRRQKFDHEIKQLQESGDQAAAEEKATEKAQFVFDDLRERVQRYPNDQALRCELGIMLYDNEYINEAIQQFQLSQRSPKHRTQSLYYLGLCFKKKKQYDLATEQLEQAASGLTAMDDTKKDIIYQLGEIAEATGDQQKAVGYYKQIYQVDIGYRDIAEKVEQAYPG